MVKRANYTPTWTSVKGFTAAPARFQGMYTKIGNWMQVIAAFDAPVFAIGENVAEISLPDGLPIDRKALGKFMISGTFNSDHFRNLQDSSFGCVLHSDDDKKARLEMRDINAAGPASCWCSFSYRTPIVSDD